MKPISKISKIFNSYLQKPIVLNLSINGTLGEGLIEELNSFEQLFVYSVADEDYKLLRNQPYLFAVGDEPSDLFRQIRIREESEFDFILQISLTKKEIIDKQRNSGNVLYPFSNLKLKPYLTFNSPQTWMFHEGITHVSGRIHFRSFAGVIHFGFDENVSTDILEVEVISFKLDYEKDFRALLSELAEKHTELILQLDQPTEIALKMKQAEDISKQVLLLHLRKLMEQDRLPLAIETILSNPHSKTSHEVNWDDPSQISRIDPLELQQNFMDASWSIGGYLANWSNGFSPDTLPEDQTISTYDTKENRFVKFCLEELELLVFQLKSELSSRYEPSHFFLESCEQTLERYLQHPFFREVGAFTHINNSMVLQKRNGYNNLLEYMQQFDMGIQLESEIGEFDTLNGDLRPIHLLYEYWCFFQLVDIMERICEQSSEVASQLIQRVERGFVLRLKHNVECNIPFTYHGITISLYYNRDFNRMILQEWNGSYDGGLYHPDFSLKLVVGEAVHWLHFDAKYKIDHNKLRSMLSEDDELVGSYKRNDIHTAHAYKDAILGSRGVYILYPDQIILNDDLFFIRQPESGYPYLIPSIGAFPLRPGEIRDKQLNEIQRYLTKIFDAFDPNQIYIEEKGIPY